LIGLVWNAFSNAFLKGFGIDLRHIITLLGLLPLMHLSYALFTFKMFSMKVLKLTKQEVVAAMYCASQKTLAFGLPLIQIFFEGNVNLAMYSAPIMFMHPLQLFLGSFMTGTLLNYTADEYER